MRIVGGGVFGMPLHGDDPAGRPRPRRPRSCRRRPSPSRRARERGGRSPGDGTTSTSAERSSIASATFDPGFRSTSCSTPSRCSSRSARSGRCWINVPPNATFSTCRPRQMASVGVPLRTAARARAMSNASTSAGTVEVASGARPRRSERGRRRRRRSAPDRRTAARPRRPPSSVIVPLEQRRLLAAGTTDGVEVAPRHDQRVGSAAGLVARSEARRDGDERAHRLPVYSRSKPLRSSQSVTCWLNQLHSCFAVLSRCAWTSSPNAFRASSEASNRSIASTRVCGTRGRSAAV